MNSRTQQPQSLGQQHVMGAPQKALPQIIHTQYASYGDWENPSLHGLGAWQFLEVYSIKDWGLQRPFQGVATQALVHDGRLVTRSGDAYTVDAVWNAYTAEAASAEASRSGEKPAWEGPGEAFLRAQIQQALLGNCGGQRVVRPDNLPIGVLPCGARTTLDGASTFEYHPVTAWEWLAEVSQTQDGVVTMATSKNTPPPEFGFFVKDERGVKGWDLDKEETASFRKIPLPFSWQSAEEMLLIATSSEVCTPTSLAAQLAAQISANVRRLALAEGWRGHIYLGLMDPEVESPQERRIPLEEIQNDLEGAAALYELPYTPSNPLHALSAVGKAAAMALYNGTITARPATPRATARWWH